MFNMQSIYLKKITLQMLIWTC